MPSVTENPTPASPGQAVAKPEIFRKVALDRLASPEQLDQLMEVANPKGWLALATLGGLMAAALVASIVGRIPERVPGNGILLRSGGVSEVTSQSSGRVVDLPIRVGDMITNGQVITRIEHPELSEQLRLARGRVAELEAQASELEALVRRDGELQATSLSQRQANLEQSQKAAEVMVANLRNRVATQQQLVAQGLVTRQALLVTEQEYEQAKERVRAIRGDHAQLNVERLQTETQHRQQLWVSRKELLEARRQLTQLEGDHTEQSLVTTPYSGEVLEVMAEQGGIVERGQPILSVSLVGRAVRDLEAVVYVPSIHGKRVRIGMEIEIVPSTVKREAYGYLRGRVTYVSDFPVTPLGMLRVLKNSRLVETLSGDDSPYEVHADLIPDASSPSQYAWSSSKGPLIRLQSGTLTTAQIVLSHRRPIDLVLPHLRPGVNP